MNKVNMALITLLSASIGSRHSYDVELNTREWEELYNEAVAHQIESVIFPEANKHGANVNAELFSQWKHMTILHVLKYSERFAVIDDVLNAMEDAGIGVMVLKGLHYKYLYNDPAMRSMGDVDILVAPQSLNAAIDVIQSFGYIKIKHDDPKHIALAHKQYVTIELHFALFTESKRKIASSFNKEIWESSYYFEKDGARFLVPSKENQLLYCCIHMTNHFGMGGFGLRQLSDFYLLAKSYSQTIDWDALLRKADSYGIGRFIEIMLMICHKLFDLDIPGRIIQKYSEDTENIEQMFEIILDAGVFGDKDKRASANRIVASYISRNRGWIASKLGYIFPSRESLNTEYSYAIKHKYLLPIAWIHRIINNICRKDLRLSEKIPDSRTVDRYVKLFKWLDIKRE